MLSLKNIIVLCFFTTNGYSQKIKMDYKIFDSNDLFEKVEKENYEFLTQLEDNLAYVYFKKDKYALFPQEGRKAILFYSKDKFNSFVEKKKYPEQILPQSFFRKDKKIIVDFNLNEIVDRFITKGYLTHKKEYDYDDIDKLSSSLKRSKEISDEDYYTLGFFLAECFRKKINGGWKLIPRYSFDVYWIPVVMDDKGKTYGESFWIKPKEMKNNLDLNFLFMLELAEYNSIPLFSTDFKKFMDGKW